MHPADQRRVTRKESIAHYWVIGRQSVTQSDLVIFLAMGGCCVNAAGASIDCDVITENDRHFSARKRMLEDTVFKCSAGQSRQYFELSYAEALHTALDQIVSEDQSAFLCADPGIIQLSI